MSASSALQGERQSETFFRENSVLQVVPPKSPRWVPGAVIRYGARPQGATARQLRPVHSQAASASPGGAEQSPRTPSSPREVLARQWWYRFLSPDQVFCFTETQRREPARAESLLLTFLREVGSAIRRAYEAGDLSVQALFSPDGVWHGDSGGGGVTIGHLPH